MSSETIDYMAVLADLETKRAALDSAILAVRQLLNLGAEQGGGPVPQQPSEQKERAFGELRSDSFFRMTMPDAICKFLEMMKRPQSVSDITKALQDGGFPTTAKNLMPSVGSQLSRMKAAGDIVNFQAKWAMASWYPAARKMLEPKANTTRRDGLKVNKNQKTWKGNPKSNTRKSPPSKLIK